MNSSKKAYGLILPKKFAEQKPVVSKASVFDNDDDSDEDRPVRKLQKYDSKKIIMKKQAQIDIEKALKEDPNAFAYDEVYDQVQAQKIEKDAAEKANVDRKPKFIHSLLKAADQRKKEDERRTERTVQREREAEKGLYDDKDAFVTESFRKKMREMKEEEERERKKRELEEQNDVTKTGDYSGFYRNLLNKKVGQSESSDVKVKCEQPEDKELEESGEQKVKKNKKADLDSDEGQGLWSRRDGEKHSHHRQTKNRDKEVRAEDGHRGRSSHSDYRRDHSTSKEENRRRKSSESDSDQDKRKPLKKSLHAGESSRRQEQEQKLRGRMQKEERQKRRRSSSSESNDRKMHKEEREKRRHNSSSESDGMDEERRHPKKKPEYSCPPPQQHTGDTDDTNDSSSSSEDEIDEERAHEEVALEKIALEKIAHEKPSSSTATTVKEKFAKKTTGLALTDAQARYLARKNAVTAAIIKE